ncbi:MAG TPA: hypothetical protein VMJ10_30485 [Kofleriaceae bacterium]|nr:hypothetical protein [Kofleriaceae bacterium]
MMRALVLVGVAASCGPTLIWSGHTEDRARSIEIIEDGGSDHFVVDGYRIAGFPAIAATSLAVAGSHVAFAARTDAGWSVVCDGRRAATWDGIGAIALAASGRLAYAAERAGGWYVVVDGVESSRLDAVLADTLRFSSDGHRVAYVAQLGPRVRAVIDGRADADADAIGRFVFSPDGAHYAYAARRGRDAFVVVDGKAGATWPAIGDIELAASGRVAYSAADGKQWRVVVDDDPGPVVDEIERIAWNDDATHVAWLARVDGIGILAVDRAPVAVAAKLHSDSYAFRPGSSELAYVVEAAAGGEQLMLDRAAGPIADEIGAPAWSPDGHLAVTARRGRTWSVIVDGRETPAGTRVATPVWSNSGRLAVVSRRGRATHVLVDGQDFPFDLAFEDSLAFSRDGRHWAIVAGDLVHEQLFFSIDGATRRPLAPSEVYSAAPNGSIFESRSDVLRTWSRAQAERAARGLE